TLENSGVGVPGTVDLASRRDMLAFAAVVGFAIQMYAIPGEWIEALAPLRLALVLSAAAAGLFVLRRIGRMESVQLDGLRGFSLLAYSGLVCASGAWSVTPDVTRDWMVELLKLVAMYITIVNVVTTPKRLAVVCAALVLSSIVTSLGVIQWYHDG